MVERAGGRGPCEKGRGVLNASEIAARGGRVEAEGRGSRRPDEGIKRPEYVAGTRLSGGGGMFYKYDARLVRICLIEEQDMADLLDAGALSGLGQGGGDVFDGVFACIDDFDLDEFVVVEGGVELFDELIGDSSMTDLNDGLEGVRHSAQLPPLPSL